MSPPGSCIPKVPAYTLSHHSIDHPEAGIVVRGDRIGGQFDLGHPHPCQIRDLKVIEVQCWQHLQFLCSQTEGSQHSQICRQHTETVAHMKINLPIFKNEDAKDAITYQSWRWDLTVYGHVGCRDCTLLPYAIWSLQGCPRELVWSMGMDITLDDVLTILDKHYNNIKALDALNQELFQLQMADKETVSHWGICLLRHLQVLAALFPECFVQTVQLSWNATAFISGYPNVLKLWWPTSKPAHRKRLIPIT